MPITDLAICLRRTDYSETSLVLRMMTRTHGQVSLMAKGVKRPKSRFGGAIDLLCVGQAVFTLPRENSVSTMGTLTAWDQVGYYPRLRTDLLRHAAAMTACELLGRLTEELDPHVASFDAMVALLEALAAGDPPLRKLAVFARSLLVDVGLTPGLERCVNCGGEPRNSEVGIRNSELNESMDSGRASDISNSAFRIPNSALNLVFSGSRGGVLCPRCPPRPGESTVQISRQLQAFFISGGEPGGKLALEITRWVVYYVQNQIGRVLNSAATLERATAAALASLSPRAALAAHADQKNKT